MLDAIVKNGLAVTPHGAGHFDIGIEGEKIAFVAPPGSLAAEAKRTLDAAGKLVVPGGIDPHMHMKWALPAPGGMPFAYSESVEHVSRAAMFGGTTTLIDFAVCEPGDGLEDAVAKRDLDFKGQSYCDYAFHLMFLGEVGRGALEELPGMIAGGHASVKLFTTDITPSRRGRKVQYGDIWEVLNVLAKAGGVAAIHAEDDDLVMHAYRRAEETGRTHFRYMPEVHSTLSEDLAFRRIIRLAESIEGAALYMMHVSAATGVDAIAESRAKGFPIYGETLHQYALFSAGEYYNRPSGQIYHTYPSLKENTDRRRLWSGMKDGTIGTVATDGICTLLETKVHGARIDDTTGGNAGVEPRMGVMYTESVVRRGFTLEQFVGLTSANAARFLGLYPRKGALAAGSDADICILDTSKPFVLTKEHLHESDYSPWEGWEIAGWPSTTMLRGRVVVEDGKLVDDRRGGAWTPRKVSEAVLFGP